MQSISYDELLDEVVYGRAKYSNKEIYTNIMTEAKKALAELKKEHPDIKKSLVLCDKEYGKEFLNGDSKSFGIIEYDVWEWTNKARDKDVTEQFWGYERELLAKLEPLATKYGGILEGDDWDSGAIHFVKANIIF